MNVLHTPSSSHEDTFLLLPWYVNGTLEPDERAHVEEHVNKCPICQQEIMLLMRVEKTIGSVQTNGQEKLVLNPQTGLDALLQRIEQSESRNTRNPGFIGRIKDYVAGLSLHPFERYGWAAALPVVALVLVTAILVWPQMPSHEPAYQTLTGQTPPAQDALRLRVIFADTTTDSDAQSVLDQMDERIVVNRSADGSYMLEVPANTGAGTITALLHTLKSNDKVATAELVLE